MNSFDKMCKKIESTPVRPLIIFRKTATNELNEFLEKCKKEILKCKKWNWLVQRNWRYFDMEFQMTKDQMININD